VFGVNCELLKKCNFLNGRSHIFDGLIVLIKLRFRERSVMKVSR
jgi:hypothetical protein